MQSDSKAFRFRMVSRKSKKKLSKYQNEQKQRTPISHSGKSKVKEKTCTVIIIFFIIVITVLDWISMNWLSVLILKLMILCAEEKKIQIFRQIRRKKQNPSEITAFHREKLGFEQSDIGTFIVRDCVPRHVYFNKLEVR